MIYDSSPLFMTRMLNNPEILNILFVTIFFRLKFICDDLWFIHAHYSWLECWIILKSWKKLFNIKESFNTINHFASIIQYPTQIFIINTQSSSLCMNNHSLPFTNNKTIKIIRGESELHVNLQRRRRGEHQLARTDTRAAVEVRGPGSTRRGTPRTHPVVLFGGVASVSSATGKKPHNIRAADTKTEKVITFSGLGSTAKTFGYPTLTKKLSESHLAICPCQIVKFGGYFAIWRCLLLARGHALLSPTSAAARPPPTCACQHQKPSSGGPRRHENDENNTNLANQSAFSFCKRENEIRHGIFRFKKWNTPLCVRLWPGNNWGKLTFFPEEFSFCYCSVSAEEKRNTQKTKYFANKWNMKKLHTPLVVDDALRRS